MTISVRVLVAVILVASNLSQSQTRSKSTTLANLAKPVEWEAATVTLFKDPPIPLKFTLTTSWIPGENHKGMMRYKMWVLPDDSNLLRTASGRSTVETLMKRAHECAIGLDLFDSGGFVLRRNIIPFVLGVDEGAQVHNLTANSSVQMDAEEYRELVGITKTAGSWSVSWGCGP